MGLLVSESTYRKIAYNMPSTQSVFSPVNFYAEVYAVSAPMVAVVIANAVLYALILFSGFSALSSAVVFLTHAVLW